MALFDSITGGAGKRAAKNNAFAIDQGLRASADALAPAYANAATLLGAGGVGNSALKEIQSGYDRSRADITQNNSQAMGLLGQSGDLYAPLAQGGANAFNSYLDATGANGALGSERAQANFRAGPGYGFQMDEALGAVQRTAAARGGLAGGNATADILKVATGLADKSWNNYVTGLGGAAAYYQPGLAGQSNALRSQAGIAQGQGAQLGALGTTLGQNSADIYRLGSNVSMQQGNAMAGLQTGAANALVANNNQLAKSQTEASANLLGGIAGLGSAALGGFGKLGGVGSIASFFGGSKSSDPFSLHGFRDDQWI